MVLKHQRRAGVNVLGVRRCGLLYLHSVHHQPSLIYRKIPGLGPKSRPAAFWPRVALPGRHVLPSLSFSLSLAPTLWGPACPQASRLVLDMTNKRGPRSSCQALSPGAPPRATVPPDGFASARRHFHEEPLMPHKTGERSKLRDRLCLCFPLHK